MFGNGANIIIMTASHYGILAPPWLGGVICISKPISFGDLGYKIRELIQVDLDNGPILTVIIDRGGAALRKLATPLSLIRARLF